MLQTRQCKNTKIANSWVFKFISIIIKVVVLPRRWTELCGLIFSPLTLKLVLSINEQYSHKQGQIVW